MAAGTRRPKITWGQFLDAAPYFEVPIQSAYWDEDADGPRSNWGPLVRAIAYFAPFMGQVSNGGVWQYLRNEAGSLPDFECAPEFVGQHPALREASCLMSEAHSQVHLLSQDIERDDELDSIDALEDAHKPWIDDFDARAWRINEACSKRLQHAIVLNPHDYFEITDANTGGPGPQESPGRNGIWRLKFAEGFPIGPNLMEDAQGRTRVLRFSSTRGHLGYDALWLGPDERDPDQHWIDFSTGLEGRREFHEGRMRGFDVRLNSQLDYDIREAFSDTGAPRHINVSIGGTSLLKRSPHLPGPYLISTPRGQVNFFADGQLNTECVEETGAIRYLRCYDEAGANLAPGGTGALRQLTEVSQQGKHWRVGTLINGYPHGEMQQLNPDGSVAWTQEWNMGRVVSQG